MGSRCRFHVVMLGLALAAVLPAPGTAAIVHLGPGSQFTISVFKDRGSAAPFFGPNAERLWNADGTAPAARRFSWSSAREFEDSGQAQSRAFARHFHFQRYRLLGINGTAPFPMAAFELGSRNRFLDDNLEINAGVFRYRYGGYRLTLPAIRGANGIGAVLPSLGMSSRTTGAELEAAYRPTRRDRFDLNASYAHARRSSLLSMAADRQIASSHYLQIVPSYAHVVPLSRGRSLSFDAAAIYRSSARVTTWALGALDPSLRKIESTRFDASLTYSSGPRFSVSAFVRNISDVRPDKSATLTTRSLANPATVSAVLSEPRTFGLMLNTRL